MWDTIFPKFIVKGYQCILIDLPCHGKSRFIGNNCGMQNMAKSLNNLLNQLNILDHIDVIGHSMGGYVGLELSQLRSVDLILLHSNFWADSESKKIDRNRVINIVEKGKKKFIQEAIPNLFAPANPEKFASIISQFIDKALEKPQKEIQAATAGMGDRKAFNSMSETTFSSVHGAVDTIISKERVMKELKTVDTNKRLITIQNVGHMSIWEDEAALIKALKSLLIP